MILGLDNTNKIENNEIKGTSGFGGYYDIEFYKDIHHMIPCKHCGKIIQPFDFVLLYKENERGRQHMIEVFCFCIFTKHQIKHLESNI